MKHHEFEIGGYFRWEEKLMQCTDIGKRTVAAIRIDEMIVISRAQLPTGLLGPARQRKLTQAEAEAAGWFNGPPYAVVEHLLDEEEQKVCHRC